MIAPQSPTLQVFVPVQAMPRADVPSERLAPIAAIQAHHVILMNGSPYRHGGNQNFLCLNGLSELTQRIMNCGNQVRRSEEHTPELQSHLNILFRLLLEKKKADQHNGDERTPT